jgi:hypothetical protein
LTRKGGRGVLSHFATICWTNPYWMNVGREADDMTRLWEGPSLKTI